MEAIFSDITNYTEYLETLTEIEKLNAPKSLYFEGNFSYLLNKKRISVVGSRNVTDNGKRRAEMVTKMLVDLDVTVVSGLAKGVDTIAHTTAIKSKGRTITVLGTPLDQCYPKENQHLLDKIKSEHLAISQFKVGQRVYQSNFPMRNRTMALISDATIIIEASEKSGTKHQGWEALRLGRELFILENLVTEKNISWTKEMLDYGAQILNRENFNELITCTPNLTSKESYEF